jgi:CelD/BcsL family acetyltransferase involved in cellulose biosynthesis
VSLTLQPWRGLAGFAALESDWQRLVERAGLEPLCNGHAWTLAYARAFALDETIFGWSVVDGREVVALLALRREPSRGPLALRRALFLADGTFDSDYLAPPIAPGREAEVAALFVDAARAERGLEALVLAGLPDESRFALALRAELTRRALPLRTHAMPCLAAALPETFEAFVAARKPRMRTKIRSALRAAEEQGAVLEWCTSASELDARLVELYDLHARRWQAEGKPGSFADPRRRAFFRALAEAALPRGELAFARLVVGGVTHATQFGMRLGATYYQIQEGFDPAHGEGRVGIALRALALRELLTRGVRRYDFMAGDSSHKRDWGGELIPCTTLAFPLPRWRARLAYRLREQVERWRGRAPTPS